MKKFIKILLCLLLSTMFCLMVACEDEPIVIPNNLPDVTVAEGVWVIGEDATNIVATDGVTPDIKFNDSGYWMFIVKTDVVVEEGNTPKVTTDGDYIKIGDVTTTVKATKGVTPTLSAKDGTWSLVLLSNLKTKNKDQPFLSENDFDNLDVIKNY